ncbi:hypothetical protein EDB87DRAFT_1833041 [Lactarius vividus]|nr:hypothetical protein EDB87DRAFT_1833041 [Lactarius vividus]
MARFQRHMLSNQREDLDMSIFHLTDSILLPHCSWMEHGSTILQAFFLLMITLVKRSLVSKRPEDAIYAARYLRHLRDQPPVASGHPRHAVTKMLVEVMALQVELEANIMGQNIGEMAVLCRELDPRKHRPHLLTSRLALARYLGYRYYMTSLSDDYEEAAAVMDGVRGSSPEEYRLSSLVDFLLEDAAKRRFDYFGSIKGPEASSLRSPLYLPVPAVDDFPGLHMYDQDIEEASIEKGRIILAPSAPRDPFASLFFGLFGSTLFEASLRTKKTEYLDESIGALRQRPSSGQFIRLKTLNQLHVTQDVDEALELLSQIFNDEHANLHDRARHAMWWAFIARDFRHPSVSTAYESALSLMQDTLLFAPTLQLQHSTLATYENSHRTSLDYVSYRVDLHQLEEAIVTLERGRALLWSEMRHLRASIDQLLQADPQLAHKFAVLNRDLEELTKSVPPSHKLSTDDDGVADDLRAVDPFGRLLLKQRGLLKKRDNLTLLEIVRSHLPTAEFSLPVTWLK